MFRRKTWAKLRVKISECPVCVGAWGVGGQAASATFSVPVLPGHRPSAAATAHTRLEKLEAGTPTSDGRLHLIIPASIIHQRSSSGTSVCVHTSKNVRILEPLYDSFMLSHFSHPEPKLADFFSNRGRRKECSQCDRSPVHWCNLLRIPAAAVIQPCYRPAGRLQESLPRSNMWA